jgi:hypothetical protein
VGYNLGRMGKKISKGKRGGLGSLRNSWMAYVGEIGSNPRQY